MKPKYLVGYKGSDFIYHCAALGESTSGIPFKTIKEAKEYATSVLDPKEKPTIYKLVPVEENKVK